MGSPKTRTAFGSWPHAVTSEPTGSPAIARWMLPARRKLNTTIGQAVVHAQRDGGGVHHLEALFQDLEVGNPLEPLRLGVEHGVRVVNAVDLRCFENDVCLDLHRA